MPIEFITNTRCNQLLCVDNHADKLMWLQAFSLSKPSLDVMKACDDRCNRLRVSYMSTVIGAWWSSTPNSYFLVQLEPQHLW